MSRDPKDRQPERRNTDVERDTGTDERPVRRERGGRSIEAEDEDRRIRPGEKRPTDPP